MTKRQRDGTTAERYLNATIEMIVEKGSSIDVNLRSVSRRIGCAHTNVYNYYSGFDDLLWASFRRAVRIYGEYLSNGLDAVSTDYEYLRRLLSRLASFPIEHTGLFRFISTDPLNIDNIPADTLESVARLKQWYIDVIGVAAGAGISGEAIDRIANIILAYISGEATDLINARVLPDDDVKGRVVANSIELFTLLTTSAGAAATVMHDKTTRNRAFPSLVEE